MFQAFYRGKKIIIYCNLAASKDQIIVSLPVLSVLGYMIKACLCNHKGVRETMAGGETSPARLLSGPLQQLSKDYFRKPRWRNPN